MAEFAMEGEADDDNEDVPGSIRSYRDLRVWQAAMTIAENCYLLTRDFPRDELFGLTSQIRRAAGSVAANIAEGHGRQHTGLFLQSLRIAQGSLKELETHLILAQRVGVAAEAKVTTVLEKSDALGRRMRALILSLQAKLTSRGGAV